jgi:hypothetical protein
MGPVRGQRDEPEVDWGCRLVAGHRVAASSVVRGIVVMSCVATGTGVDVPTLGG